MPIQHQIYHRHNSSSVITNSMTTSKLSVL